MKWWLLRLGLAVKEGERKRGYYSVSPLVGV